MPSTVETTSEAATDNVALNKTQKLAAASVRARYANSPEFYRSPH